MTLPTQALFASAAFAPRTTVVDIPEPTEVPLSAYADLSLPELNEKIKANRQSFLAIRLDVILKANDAKQRLEEYTKSDKYGGKSIDSLKKDLETIKEAQRVLAAVLSEIINLTTGSELSLSEGMETQSDRTAENAILSREYLDRLARLYDEKTKQLVWIADSLDKVAAAQK